jgi:O-methyltransferase
MKNTLTRRLIPERAVFLDTFPPGFRGVVLRGLRKIGARALKTQKLQFAAPVYVDPNQREVGRDWPTEAETMIGMRRLDNLQWCITQTIRNSVPGDLIETGVWRGGATIFMRAVLKAYGVTDRRVFVADSFAGLPKPSPELYPHDKDDPHWTYKNLAVGVDIVKANFARYGLLDDQVQFLVGWFRDTLPTAPIERLAVARLDGDMYESTMDGLANLYDKLSVGGYIIIDDYKNLKGCRQAVDDFRTQRQICEPIQEIDWTGVFWQKTSLAQSK